MTGVVSWKPSRRKGRGGSACVSSGPAPSSRARFAASAAAVWGWKPSVGGLSSELQDVWRTPQLLPTRCQWDLPASGANKNKSVHRSACVF